MAWRPGSSRRSSRAWPSLDGLEEYQPSIATTLYTDQDEPFHSFYEQRRILVPRWNLFYVAYRSMPTDGTRFLLNHAGEIWRAVSRTSGREGIRGPFEDVGVVMRPGPDSLPWEGLQGTDSFFAWPAGGRWRAFYGSARTETKPIGHWLVGPAEGPRSPARGGA